MGNNLFHSSTKTMFLKETQNLHTLLQDDGRSKDATRNCKKKRLILIPYTRTQNGPDTKNIFWALHVKKKWCCCDAAKAVKQNFNLYE